METGTNEVHEILGSTRHMSPEIMNAIEIENGENSANGDSTNEKNEDYD